MLAGARERWPGCMTMMALVVIGVVSLQEAAGLCLLAEVDRGPAFVTPPPPPPPPPPPQPPPTYSPTACFLGCSSLTPTAPHSVEILNPQLDPGVPRWRVGTQAVSTDADADASLLCPFSGTPPPRLLTYRQEVYHSVG